MAKAKARRASTGRIYYELTPEERKKNILRKRARRAAVKKYGEAYMKGKDVDHKRPLSKGGSNTPKNLRVISTRKNRQNNKRPKSK